MARILPTEHTEDTEDFFVSVSSACSVGKLSDSIDAAQPR